MSIKNKVLAAAATMTLIGGVGAMGTLTANAATPSCGGFCVNVFSRDFGTHASPNFVLDTLRQGEKVGQPQILFRTANFDPAEDYTFSYQGTVADFFAADLVSAAVNLHYSADSAWEIQYSPYGVDSGLCAGVAATAVAGEKVTLQPCGVSAKTVWIYDAADSIHGGSYAPAINGSDTNFSQPFVLTYPASAYPTDMPRPELYVTNLTGFQGANGLPIPGTVNSNQLFGATFGVLK